ncbi:MAG TPA: 3-hydroxyacyl-CoA dehydrogenase NAD-binding domain-containing protein [Candidatus Polarisedimenticolia bacterium]|nr:3-hydroxyacyl-CoA dehydrogenase NAD-binding domain-containing protein [Candidatus Polarisedimenticolia bacterium]
MALARIAVLGAGTMGNGIAQVFAQHGHFVVLRDLDRAILERARTQIEKSLARLAEKGKIPPGEMDEALARITLATEAGALAECDLVVEAVVESLGVKTAVLQEADRITRPAAILASNTSSISITKLGAATRRPDKVIGMHFMNPVPIMALVEVIRGQATSDETTRTVMDLARSLGKTPVEVNDFPGFVSNRVLMPMINEAIFAVYEGVAKPEAIDDVLEARIAAGRVSRSASWSTAVLTPRLSTTASTTRSHSARA